MMMIRYDLNCIGEEVDVIDILQVSEYSYMHLIVCGLISRSTKTLTTQIS